MPILLGVLKYSRYLAKFGWIFLFRSFFGLRQSGGGDIKDTLVFRGHYMKHNHVRKSLILQNEIGNLDVVICMKTRFNFIRLVDFLY